MAHTINDRNIQKIGRYSKELIKVTFTSTSATPATLDTRMATPLYGRVYYPFDKGNTALNATVIITNNVVTLSNRNGAGLNGQTIVVELTGY